MIAGEMVALRPFIGTDVAFFEQRTNDFAYHGEFNSFGLQPHGKLQSGFAHSGLLDPRQGMLVVVLRGTETIVGNVSYHQVGYGPNEGSQSYNIGIALAPEQRGKGYGVEAQRLLAAYLFATYPVMRIEASTDINNLAEQRSLEKAGFTREGIARKAQWRAGQYHDLVTYSKLRGE